jgi:hypothetical protein
LIEASIRIARLNKREIELEDVVDGIKYIGMGEMLEDMNL